MPQRWPVASARGTMREMEGPSAMTESDLKNALLESRLPHKELLAAMARPAIHALATPTEGDIPLGTSRIGGLPDMPKSLVWPMWHDLPHMFVGQINLAELPDIAERHLLPRAGHLYFFYEPETGFFQDVPECFGSWKVLYSAEPPIRMPAEEAGDAPWRSEPWPLGSLRLTFSELWTVPQGNSIWCHLPLDDWKEVDTFMEGFYRRHNVPPWYKHQLFGFADWMGHDEDEAQCELIRRGLSRYKIPPESLRLEIEEAAKDWLLLFQINHEGDRGSVAFGDVGAMFYWIRQSDLERHDFSAACALMASH